MSRVKAATLHLGVSAVIVSAVVASLYLIWYPPPLFQTSGLDRFLIILVGVDLTIGPLLTLIVFRAGKPGLKLDLTLIGLAQVAALAYGLYVMWQARPVYMVAAVDRIELVNANEIDEQYLEEAKDTPYASLPPFGAELVALAIPTDTELRNRLMDEVLSGKPDLPLRPRYYAPYESASQQLIAKGHAATGLFVVYPELRDAVSAIADELNVSTTDLIYVPLTGANRPLTVLLNPSDARILAIFDKDPWAAIQHKREQLPGGTPAE